MKGHLLSIAILLLVFLLFFLLFFLLASLTGCSLSQKGGVFKKRRAEESFLPSEVARYVLPVLPLWANFSQTADCRRTFSPRYLDLNKLRQSFSLSYAQGVQFQYMFNVELERLKNLSLKDEETLFYNVSEKIQSGITLFRRPSFKRVHLIWADSLIVSSTSSSSAPQRIKRLLESDLMAKGHPVLLSLCLGHFELKKFLQDESLNRHGLRFIPFEMFFPFR